MNTDTMRLISFLLPTAVFGLTLLFSVRRYAGRCLQGKRKSVTVTVAAAVYFSLCLLLYITAEDDISFLSGFSAAAFTSGCTLTAVTDIAEKKIYTAPAALIAVSGFPELVVSCINNGMSVFFVSALPGTLICGGVLLAAHLLDRNGVGTGDVLLFAAVGFSLGFYSSVRVLFYTLVFSAVTGLVLLVSGKYKLRDELPLAPFVLLGYAAGCII